MKKLSTLFSITVLSTTLALAGCSKKRSEEGKEPAQPAQKTTEPTTPTPTPTPTTPEAKPGEPAATAPGATAPGATAPGATAPAATTPTDLPAECMAYKDAANKLSTCDKLDAKMRDQMKADFDKASAGWTNLSASAKTDAAKQCATATEAINKACGWK